MKHLLFAFLSMTWATIASAATMLPLELRNNFGIDGTGVLIYDEVVVAADPRNTAIVGRGLISLELNILGVTFTEDDAFRPEALFFPDGTSRGLRYRGRIGDTELSIVGLGLGTLAVRQNGVIVAAGGLFPGTPSPVTSSPAPVPLPASSGLLALSLGGLWLARNRRKRA